MFTAIGTSARSLAVFTPRPGSTRIEKAYDEDLETAMIFCLRSAERRSIAPHAHTEYASNFLLDMSSEYHETLSDGSDCPLPTEKNSTSRPLFVKIPPLSAIISRKDHGM